MVYDYFDSDVVGRLTVAGDERGLRHIDFQNDRTPMKITGAWKRDPHYFKSAMTQLQAYFSGELREFDLPLAPEGTDFQLRVWEVLEKIPYGELKSYQWVAEQIGNPKAVRAVGGANGKNPLPIVIPCHRVIGRNGALIGFGGGLRVKQRLIELENPGRHVFRGQMVLPFTETVHRQQP